MAHYIFPGYPVFFQRAAEELGSAPCPPTSAQVAVLAPLANLCAQVDPRDPAGSAPILARVAEFRDRLRVTLRAADLMLAEVEAGARAAAVADPAADPVPSRSSRSQRGGK